MADGQKNGMRGHFSTLWENTKNINAFSPCIPKKHFFYKLLVAT